MNEVRYLGGLGETVTLNFQPGSRVFTFEVDQVLVLPADIAKQLLDSEYFEVRNFTETQVTGE